MTAPCTRNITNLNSVAIQFFEMVPVRRIQWPNEEIDSDDLDIEAQRYMLSRTVNNDLCRQYPPSIQYQRTFVKKLLTTLEGFGVEICDELYETYTGLLQCTDLEDDTLCYKTYTVDEDVRITIQESVNMISLGTTGLSTWQAAQHLAEWAIQNVEQLADRNILEIGCGLGLTGLTVCKRCRVNTYTFTDCHTQVLDLLDKNIRHNFEFHINELNRDKKYAEVDQTGLNGNHVDCDTDDKCGTVLDCDTDDKCGTRLDCDTDDICGTSLDCDTDDICGTRLDCDTEENSGTRLDCDTVSLIQSAECDSSNEKNGTSLYKICINGGSESTDEPITDFANSEHLSNSKVETTDQLIRDGANSECVDNDFESSRDHDTSDRLKSNGDINIDHLETNVKEFRISNESCCKCIRLARLDWEYIDANLVEMLADTDVILAADVVYDTRIIPALVSVLKMFLGQRLTSSAYVASTIRNEDTRDQFLVALTNEGLKYKQVDPPTLKLFHYDRSVPIEIICITR